MNEGVQEKLDAPLDPSKVASRDAGRGRTVPYLEGWYVVSAANGIFGFDGWSHEVLGIEHMGNGIYMARVRVEALGVTRLDVGTSTASVDTAEAHETAIKGAATDGLKRALRTFGAQFGNELYDKGAATPSQGAQGPQDGPRASGTTQRAPEGTEVGFANVGRLLTWASTTHKMTKANVLDALAVASVDDIDLDTARGRIEEVVAGR